MRLGLLPILAAVAACTPHDTPTADWRPEQPALHVDAMVGLQQLSTLGLQADATSPFGIQIASDGRAFAHNPPAGGTVTWDDAGTALPSGLQLSTTGVGRANAEPFVAHAVTTDAHTVHWEGSNATAWMVSGPLGLSQGWTLHTPPAGDGPVRIELAITGGHAVSDDGITLLSDDGAVHSWSDLYAFDAEHRSLPVYAMPTADGLRIEVDDREATWPITVDPRIVIRTQGYDLAAELNTFDRLGATVQFDGEALFAGAPGSTSFASGHVQVFEPAIGGYQHRATLIGNAGDRLGTSMCKAGSQRWIGAPGWLNGDGQIERWDPASDTYVFADTLRGDASLATGFGTALLCTADAMLVGTPLPGLGGVTDSGALWPFKRVNGLWERQGPVVPTDNTAFGFGTTVVAIDDDTVAVGAPGAHDGAGGVWIYDGWPNTLSLVTELSGTGLGPNAALGAVMTSAEGRLYMGVPSHDNDRGGVFVSTESNGVWSAPALWAQGDALSDAFGTGLTACGNGPDGTLLVGAPGANGGSAMRYTRPTAARLTTVVGQDHADTAFGSALACNDTHLAMGAPLDDQWADDAGTVWVHALSDDGLPAQRLDGWTATHTVAYEAHDAILEGSFAATTWSRTQGFSPISTMWRFTGTWWEAMPSPGWVDEIDPTVPRVRATNNRFHDLSDDDTWTRIPDVDFPAPTTYVETRDNLVLRVETSPFVSGLRQLYTSRFNGADWDTSVVDLPDLFSLLPVGTLNGNTLALHAVQGTVDGVPGAGRLALFAADGDGWSLSQVLEAPQPEDEARFSQALALEDNAWLVLSSGDSTAPNNQSLWSYRMGASGLFEPEGRIHGASNGLLLPAWDTATVNSAAFQVHLADDRLAVLGNHLAVFSRSPHDHGWVQLYARDAGELASAGFGFDGDHLIVPLAGGIFLFETLEGDDLMVDLDASQPGIQATQADIQPGDDPQSVVVGDVTWLPQAPSEVREISAALLDRLDGSDETLVATEVPFGWTSTWDDASGQLTLAIGGGTPIPSTYAADILASIAYQHQGTDFTLGTRRVHLAVNRDVVIESGVFAHPVNAFPTVWLGGNTGPAQNYATTYVEGGAPVTVAAPDAFITDADSLHIGPLTATLSGALDSGESLSAVAFGSITASWTSPTLTLSGADTPAEYSNALRTLTYAHAGTTLTPGPRTITVQASDNVGFGPASTTQLTVLDNNVAPSVSLSSASPSSYATTFTEGNPPVSLVDPSASLQDVDDVNLVELKAVLSPMPDGADEVVDAFAPPGLVAQRTTDTLTVSGTASVATYEQVLASLTYHNASTDPDTTPRTVTITVSDGSAPSAPVVTTVSVVGVDSPPELDLDTTTVGVDATTPYVEGSGSQSPFPSAAITDVDGGLQATTLQITLENPLDGGLEALSFPAIIAGVTPTVDPSGHALTLTGPAVAASFHQALLGVRYAHQGTNPNPTARTFTVSLEGAVATGTLLIELVDDAPVLDLDTTQPGVDTVLALTEGAPAIAFAPNALVADPDDTMLDSLVLDVSDALDVALEQDVSAVQGTWDANARTLTYSAHAVGTLDAALASLSIAVSHNAPSEDPSTILVTASASGQSTQAIAHITITATDQPATVSLGGNTTFTEDGPPVALAPSSTASDPDSTTVPNITVTWNALDGSDEHIVSGLTHAPVVSGSPGSLTFQGPFTLTEAINVLHSLTYENTSQDPSSITRLVTVQLGGGSDSLQIAVVPVDDAPSIDLGPATDSSLDFSTSLPGGVQTVAIAHPDASILDVDSPTIGSLTATLSGALDGSAEAVVYTGTALTATSGTQAITIQSTAPVATYEAALQDLAYTHTGLTVTPGERQVVITVAGISGPPSLEAVTTITVGNTPPVVDLNGAAPGTDASVTWTEDGAPVTVATAADISDVDNVTLTEVRLVMGAAEPGEVLDAPLGTSTWDASTGTLVLTGPDTPAALQTALRAVTYSHTTQDPIGNRTVTITASDASGASAPAVLTIERVAVPDLPVLDLDTQSLADPVATWTFGDGLADVLPTTVGLTDVDNTTVAGIQVDITPWDEGFESFELTAPSGTVISVVNGSASSTESAPVADWAQAIQALRYAVLPGATDLTDRTITLAPRDESGTLGMPDTFTLTIDGTPVDTDVTDGPTDTDVAVDTDTDTPIDTDDTDTTGPDTDVPTDSDTDSKEDGEGCNGDDDAGCSQGSGGRQIALVLMALMWTRRRRHAARAGSRPVTQHTL